MQFACWWYDLEGLRFPALQSVQEHIRPGCKDRLPHWPDIFSPHLKVLRTVSHNVIYDFLMGLRLTLAEVVLKDPKGYIESWTWRSTTKTSLIKTLTIYKYRRWF